MFINKLTNCRKFALKIRKHLILQFLFNSVSIGAEKGLPFCLIFAIYKYIYKISMCKLRKPKEANKAYVKDYREVKDT